MTYVARNLVFATFTETSNRFIHSIVGCSSTFSVDILATLLADYVGSTPVFLLSFFQKSI